MVSENRKKKKKANRKLKKQQQKSISQANGTPKAVMAVATVAGQQSLSQGAAHATPAAQKEATLDSQFEKSVEELSTLQSDALAITGADKGYSVDGNQENIDMPLVWSLPPLLQEMLKKGNSRSKEVLTQNIASMIAQQLQHDEDDHQDEDDEGDDVPSLKSISSDSDGSDDEEETDEEEVDEEETHSSAPPTTPVVYPEENPKASPEKNSIDIDLTDGAQEPEKVGSLSSQQLTSREALIYSEKDLHELVHAKAFNEDGTSVSLEQHILSDIERRLENSDCHDDIHEKGYVSIKAHLIPHLARAYATSVYGLEKTHTSSIPTILAGQKEMGARVSSMFEGILSAFEKQCNGIVHDIGKEADTVAAMRRSDTGVDLAYVSALECKCVLVTLAGTI